MRGTRIALLCLVSVAATGGCQKPGEPVEPTVTRISAETPESYQALWESAADTLRQHYFRLDRQDRTAGVITTFPETSANWFELWRPQPEPAYAWAEANTKTMQRQAKVHIRPTPEAGAYDVDVEVQQFQYSLQERQVDNSAAAMRLFSSAAPVTSGRMLRPEESSHWIPQGRDAALEQRLLNRIVERYVEAPVVSTRPSEFGQP